MTHQYDTTGLLERFLRYARIDTQAIDDTDRYPSSPGQLELGRLLVEELRALGLGDAHQDQHGYVLATVPATPGCEQAPVVAFFAHLDTSPEKSGAGITPIVHRGYGGGDLVLPGDPSQVLRLADNPDLADKRGQDIITSDGRTLLGADDKAGVAELVTAVAVLQANRDLPHGTLRLVFTCDEEIGRGVEHLDLGAVAARVGYTLDGERLGELEGETFSADLATVRCLGFNTHPGYAKGKLVNALKLAGAFLSRLPVERWSPESTAGREGFVHPYVIEGGVDQVTIKVLVRDFDGAGLARHEEQLRALAADVQQRFGRGSVQVEIKEQYRNMRDGLAAEPRAMALARAAIERAGLTLTEKSIRGGTDGSRLTAMGLPTPNLFAGGHNFHSTLEWVSLQDMEQAVAVVIELARLWGQER